MMKPTMRMSPLRRVVFGTLLSLASGLAAGQAPWPARPIRIIVPFPAGGQTDVAARVIGQALGEALKTTVVIGDSRRTTRSAESRWPKTWPAWRRS